DDRKLLAVRLGITNLVSRTTAAAAELDPAELRRGASRLARKVERYRPGFVAFAGMGAYRTAFRRPDAAVGRQPEPLSGAVIWLLPNPSGAQGGVPARRPRARDPRPPTRRRLSRSSAG